jgi:hypothetical protein
MNNLQNHFLCLQNQNDSIDFFRNLPTDLLRYITLFTNIIDNSNLYFVNLTLNQIIYESTNLSFNQYKNIIEVNISDFHFIKNYIHTRLTEIYPIGYNVNSSIRNIINDKDYIPYYRLLTLITVLKIGRALLLSNYSIMRIENTNLETWIKIAYSKYINCLVERKQMCKNNIFCLILYKKIRFKKDNI